MLAQRFKGIGTRAALVVTLALGLAAGSGLGVPTAAHAESFPKSVTISAGERTGSSSIPRLAAC